MSVIEHPCVRCGADVPQWPLANICDDCSKAAALEHSETCDCFTRQQVQDHLNRELVHWLPSGDARAAAKIIAQRLNA